MKPDEGIKIILHHFNDLQVKGQDLSEWRNGVWTKAVLSALCKAGGDHDFYVNASNVGDSGEWLFDACWSGGRRGRLIPRAGNGRGERVGGSTRSLRTSRSS